MHERDAQTPIAAPIGLSGLDASTPKEPAPATLEVEVRSRDRSGKRLAASSAAVMVVDVEQARTQTGDLGTLLGRQAGVNVQRAGGLGAQTRILLQGLGEDQIRFYVDGVPLAYTGLPETIAYVPTDLVSRVEAYRGVVPIRFGGDTLGGAIQLVSPRPRAGLSANGSLTVGDLGTQRAALHAARLAPESGSYASVQAFFDHARNDYRMRGIPVAQLDGTTVERSIYRQHAAYRGGYGQLELGLLQRRFAERLLLRAFTSGFHKEINHDVLMQTPYGEVTSRRRAQGAVLFYDVRPSRRASLESRFGYAYRERSLRDLGKCAYDWYRNCVATLPNGGEIFGLPADRRTLEHDLYLRVLGSYRFGPLAQLRASLAPTYVRSRAHDEAVPASQLDPFAQRRELLGVVLGLEHQLDAFSRRLENVFFAKDYLQVLAGEATTSAGTAALDRTHHRIGVGNGVRVRLHESTLIKASYELGARMPDAAEVFGDGVLIDPNLTLRPERSHNANLELRWGAERERVGRLDLSAAGFLRYVSEFIFLLPGSPAKYQNLADARVRGVEGSLHYVSPEQYLSVESNITYQDTENRADRGPFAMFEGARVPNRPFLFGNVTVAGRIADLVTERDALTLTLRGNYIGKFYRAFDLGRVAERDVVPRQLVSSASITYELADGDRGTSFSLELHNLTDARAYDFFGVQRPGRYALAKWTFRL